MNLHACIICWNKRESDAQKIADDIYPFVDNLTVIYSNLENKDFEGTGDWLKVNDRWFYGKKFAKFLCSSKLQDIHLIIQADAICGDWPRLVEECRREFCSRTSLGIWIPKLEEGTPWRPRRIDLWRSRDQNAVHVAFIDGRVWSFSANVLERLREISFQHNNLGWGIEGLCVAYCYSKGLSVIRSENIEVKHTPGAGYDRSIAAKQQIKFLKQLNEIELIVYNIIKKYTEISDKSNWIYKIIFVKRIYLAMRRRYYKLRLFNFIFTAKIKYIYAKNTEKK